MVDRRPRGGYPGERHPHRLGDAPRRALPDPVLERRKSGRSRRVSGRSLANVPRRRGRPRRRWRYHPALGRGSRPGALFAGAAGGILRHRAAGRERFPRRSRLRGAGGLYRNSGRRRAVAGCGAPRSRPRCPEPVFRVLHRSLASGRRLGPGGGTARHRPGVRQRADAQVAGADSGRGAVRHAGQRRCPAALSAAARLSPARRRAGRRAGRPVRRSRRLRRALSANGGRAARGRTGRDLGRPVLPVVVGRADDGVVGNSGGAGSPVAGSPAGVSARAGGPPIWVSSPSSGIRSTKFASRSRPDCDEGRRCWPMPWRNCTTRACRATRPS